MKKTILAIFAVAGFISTSQAQCNGGRYASDVFTDFTATPGITFGANTSAAGANTVLKLDFYEPTGDVETKRPLIILAHGGSFQFGSSTDGDVTELCKRFAKKGYATASINYRLGFFPLDSVNAVKAVARAVQDMKAAIRFFYKDSKEGINQFKIDTNNIFIGGSSAGAITALHVAYLDRSCELEQFIGISTINSMGGVEGNSGNPCYSSKVKGVINLCGALANYSWLETGDAALCSMHGTNDGTVKYNRAIVNPGVPIMYLDGSRMIYEHTENINFDHNFYTFYGADHVPYASDADYMDTTVNFVRDFLVQQLGCSESELQAANAPAQTATLYAGPNNCTANVQTNFCLTAGLNEEKSLAFNLFPNPSQDKINVELGEGNHIYSIELYDISGRLLFSKVENTANFTLDKATVGNGTFILKISNEANFSSTKKVIFY